MVKLGTIVYDVDGKRGQIPITPEMRLWFLRMAVGEGGPGAELCQIIVQRHVYRMGKPSEHDDVIDIIGDFSQPVNDNWTETGVFCRPGGKGHGKESCSPARLEKRAFLIQASEQELMGEGGGSKWFSARTSGPIMRSVDAWIAGEKTVDLPGHIDWAVPGNVKALVASGVLTDVARHGRNWSAQHKGQTEHWPADAVRVVPPGGSPARASKVAIGAITAAVTFGVGMLLAAMTQK